MFRRRFDRWAGIVLVLVASVATVWLGFSGQLGLYIHPRYFVFTLILAVVGLLFVIGTVLVKIREDLGAEDSALPAPGSRVQDRSAGGVSGRLRWRRLSPVWTAAVAAACAFGIVAMLILPPTTLSQATVDQRSVNSGSVLADGSVSASGDTADFDVKEWATLLRQSTDLSGLTGKQATVLGFVSADKDDPDNVFYVTRFFVTCCAADAQPLGVPVYKPGWTQELSENEWIQVSGAFELNPSVQSRQPLTIKASDIAAVAQPDEPYVY